MNENEANDRFIAVKQSDPMDHQQGQDGLENLSHPTTTVNVIKIATKKPMHPTPLYVLFFSLLL